MVETQFPIVVMNHPRRRFDPVPIRFEIRVNKYLAFFWRGVDSTSPEEISCSDIIFDKQRLDDCISQKGCGCYHMNHQRYNLELVNTIRIDNGQYLTMMLNSSSIKFLKLYTNKYITFSVRIRDICITEDYFILPNYIRKVVMLINENEGFTCVF